MLFIYVFEQIEPKRTAIRIGEIKKQIQDETDLQDSLKIELSRLESPKRLDVMANKMKFSMPGNENIIYLQEQPAK